MRRRNWPTVQELGRRLNRHPGHLRRLAIKLAPRGLAFMELSASGQTCWRVDPKAIASRIKKRHCSNRPPMRPAKCVPIHITIHIPEATLKRLFGRGSNGD